MSAEVGTEVEAVAATLGTVFTSFPHHDSGCRAYGVAAGDRRWFVKGGVAAHAVASLRRARRLHADVAHPAVVPLRRAIDTASGLVLVYPWVDGEVLYGAPGGGRAARVRAGSPLARFRSRPLDAVLRAFDRVLDAHVAVAAAGHVAVDLYDGSFLYDFATDAMWLCDLDEYRPGPFVLDADRLPGSARFMAPEEWTRGATIDERTTVHAVGRAGAVLLDAGDLGEAFRGTPAMAAVLADATRPESGDRIQTVAELAWRWREAVGR